ncbi:MAG: hypothetical protein M1837_004058 [Sclerophora amabilis]|nr:MAG: hypothetical protein M1837_004058 [Sclerophora amabilis]
MANDVAQASLLSTDEVKYGGYSRFELELEFVQCLSVKFALFTVVRNLRDINSANPWYLNHLATQKLFDNPSLVAYLHYLQYFARPEYVKFLTYPGPTLKALQLLQQESFRKDILSPDTARRLTTETMNATSNWLGAA